MLCLLMRAYQFLFCLGLLLLFFFLNIEAALSSSSSSNVNPSCSPHEEAALIQFKSSLFIDEYNSYSWVCNDAGFQSYPKTDSWKEGTNCCEWDGVSCDNSTTTTSQSHGNVIGLDLSCSWLYGTIHSNSSLFHLQHLRKLNLAFNSIIGSNIMSSKFGEFSSLEYLNLSNTFFDGVFESSSHLSKLVSLDLSSSANQLESQPLEEHTLQGLIHNLTQLTTLALDFVDMSSVNPRVFVNLTSSLRSLSLQGCGLRGEFPDSFLYRPNLRSLRLGDNEELSLNPNMVNRSSYLELLDLWGVNTLSTEFVRSIASLQSLKYLYLSTTSFPRGLLDSIMNLTSLELLEAFNADVFGTLPDSIGNLVSLKHLNLRGTMLRGSIPISLGKLSQLRYLELSDNQLSGQIPSSLTNLTRLEFLSLSGNELEGSIPDEVTATFPNLITLDLSVNFLNQTLPSWLFSAPSLKQISLSQNQLSGHIKEFQSKSLVWINLENNKLQGPIPSSISQLVNLTTFYISSNNLSGILEFDMFSKLQNLDTLDLSYNRLSLNFNGTSLDDYTLPNLQTLRLASCNVSEFSPLFTRLEGLKILDLSQNRIQGKLPEWVWDAWKDSLTFLNLSHNFLTSFEQLPWKNINFLDLSSNLIHGDVLIPPSKIRGFFLSDNRFSGEISSHFCNATSLEVLDLSHNNLSGTIPQCFGNFTKLSFLNLKRNKFHGIIPPTFTEKCQLTNLNLNGNLLEGPLTPSINNCSKLEVVDVGNNKFKGTFPHWLGDLSQLQVLVLSSNQLHGSIQDTSTSSHSFSKIQIFDISNNNFTGPLPVRHIENFKSMMNLTKDENSMPYMGVQKFGSFYSYSIGIAIKGVEFDLVKIFTMFTALDLSNNKFHGEIPMVIGKLNSLKGLNVSHNSLDGGIPTSMGNLVNLEWLDLSSNMLSGMIPGQLTSLTYLSILNVSENQLHGRIPQGKQFQTFGNASYQGNKGLCGFPVSKGCGNSESPPPLAADDDDGSNSIFAFGWKVVLIGYGCGVGFGLIVGFVVFQNGKPKWLVNLVEDLYPNHGNKKKYKTRRSSISGGRRM